jgi:hypothetical protein
LRRCHFKFLGAWMFLDGLDGIALVRVGAKSKKIN